MRPPFLHSYLLWRSAVDPDTKQLASSRMTASVALVPALMVGLFVFGWYAGVVVLTALAAALAADLCTHRYANRFIFNNPSGTGDCTWLLTGLLVGLLMPPAVPLWVPALGSILAIVVGKHWLSVDGMPLLQPAAASLLLLHMLFIPVMHPTAEGGGAKWPVLARPIEPAAGSSVEETVRHALKEFLGGDIRTAIDRQRFRDENFNSQRGERPAFSEGVTAQAYYGPRPLDVVRENRNASIAELKGVHRYDWLQLFLGGTPGSIGGSSALALLLGLLMVVFTGAISWVLPLFAMGTLAAGLYLSGSPNVGIHLLSGYTLLGFFYLAADPASVARSKRGKALAGVSVGLLEFFLRSFTPLSEGTFVSAVLIQGLSIVFDQYVAPPKVKPPPTDHGLGI